MHHILQHLSLLDTWQMSLWGTTCGDVFVEYYLLISLILVLEKSGISNCAKYCIVHIFARLSDSPHRKEIIVCL